MRFDDFIQCCLVLHVSLSIMEFKDRAEGQFYPDVQGITDMFRAEDTDLDGVVTISYEKFLTMLLNSSLL